MIAPLEWDFTCHPDILEILPSVESLCAGHDVSLSSFFPSFNGIDREGLPTDMLWYCFPYEGGMGIGKKRKLSSILMHYLLLLLRVQSLFHMWIT